MEGSEAVPAHETCPTGVVREVCPVPWKLDKITKHREGRKDMQVRNAARAKRGGCPDSSVAPGGRRQGRKQGAVQAGHEVDIQPVEAVHGSARKIAGLHLENRDEPLVEMLECGVPRMLAAGGVPSHPALTRDRESPMA